MEEPVSIPDDAVPYILLQRTETQALVKDFRYLVPYGREIYNLVYNKFLYKLEARVRQQEIKSEYLDYLREEYEELRDELPREVDRILNVGCGIGGMNLFLADHYQDRDPEFVLFDKSKISSDVYYQFNEDSAYYNSLDLAGDVLATNGVSRERITLLDADENDMAELEGIDFCISLLSWGFHYPVETYLDDLRACMNPGGTLLLDLRKGTDGLEICREAFEEHEVIADTEKYRRTRFSNPEPLESSQPREPAAAAAV